MATTNGPLASGQHGQSFVAYTDGSYRLCPDAHEGGWAVALFSAREERWEFWGGTNSAEDNNRAELCGLLAAVISVPDGSRLSVMSDSRYVVDGLNLRRGREHDVDLWLEISELVLAKHLKLSATWVHGHRGWDHNTRADTLAGLHGRLVPAATWHRDPRWHQRSQPRSGIAELDRN